MIIDQLSANREMALHYLEKGGIAAIKLALSEQGGASGSRSFPFMQHEGAWEVLTQACIREGTDPKSADTTRVLATLDGASTSKIRPELKQVIARVCVAVRENWNGQSKVVSPGVIKTFLNLCDRCGTYIEAPSLRASLMHCSARLKAAAKEAADDPASLRDDELSIWLAMVDIVRSTEPRLIPSGRLATTFDPIVTQYIEAASGAMDEELGEYEDSDEFQAQARRFEELSSTFSELVRLFPNRTSELNSISDRLNSHSESLREEADSRNEDREDDPDDRSYSSRSTSQEVSIEKMFEDL